MYGLEDYTRIKHVMSATSVSDRGDNLMRILLVGAGGVGSAFAAIAARRDFFEAIVIADYDAAQRRARRRGRRPLRRGAGRRLRRRRRSPRCAASTRITHVMNAVDPRFVMPIFDGALERRRRLPRHGDVAVAPAPGRAVREGRREARRRAVRRGRRVGGRAAGSRWSGIGVEPGLSDVFARYAADHLFRDIDELGTRDGAEPGGRGPRLRAVVLDLDHDRGVPQPAGDLKARTRRWFTTAAVLRAGGLRLPRGHRAGRVRQRRARGGAPDAALGRLHSGRRSSTASATSSSTCSRRCTSSASTAPRRSGSGASRSPARRGRRRACPTRPTLGPRMTGQDLRRPVGHRHGQGRRAALDVPLPRGRQRVVDARVRPPVRRLADRGQPGGRARAARARHLVGRRRARPGGLRRGAVPRPADRVRQPLGSRS